MSLRGSKSDRGVKGRVAYEWMSSFLLRNTCLF